MADAQAPVTSNDVLAQIQDGKLVPKNNVAADGIAGLTAPGAQPTADQQVLLNNVAADMNAKAAARDITTLPIDQLSPDELAQVAAARVGELSIAQIAALPDAVRATLTPNVLAAAGLQAPATDLTAVKLTSSDGKASVSANVTPDGGLEAKANVAGPSESAAAVTVPTAAAPDGAAMTNASTSLGKVGGPQDALLASLAAQMGDKGQPAKGAGVAA